MIVNIIYILLKSYFNASQVVPLFEADKPDNFEDVYEENKALSSSGSCGRLASLLAGESPEDDFIVINEKEGCRSSSTNNSAGQVNNIR